MDYSTTTQEGTVKLSITGELDALTVSDLRLELDKIAKIAADDGFGVVVDLTALRLIDSSGVGALVSLFKRVRAKGRQFQVSGTHGQPLSVFQVLRLDRVLDLR